MASSSIGTCSLHVVIQTLDSLEEDKEVLQLLDTFGRTFLQLASNPKTIDRRILCKWIDHPASFFSQPPDKVKTPLLCEDVAAQG